jgi:hypothetical protein
LEIFVRCSFPAKRGKGLALPSFGWILLCKVTKYVEIRLKKQTFASARLGAYQNSFRKFDFTMAKIFFLFSKEHEKVCAIFFGYSAQKEMSKKYKIN